MTREECIKLVRDIFGDEAAADEDIVDWYMEVNKVALDETYNQAIDDAIEAINGIEKSWPFGNDQDGEFMLPYDDVISKLNSLKK